MSTSDLMARAMKEVVDRRQLDPILKGIDEATWPWKMRGTIFVVEFDIDDGFNYLLIESRFGHDLNQVYWHKMPLPRLAEYEELKAMIIESFTDHFRHWRTEPESNICLGED